MSPASYPFQSLDTLAAVTTKIVKKQAWEYVKHWKGGVGGVWREGGVNNAEVLT